MAINIAKDFFNVWVGRSDSVDNPQPLHIVEDEARVFTIEPNKAFSYGLSISTFDVDGVSWALVGLSDDPSLLAIPNEGDRAEIQALPAGTWTYKPARQVTFTPLKTSQAGYSIVFLPLDRALTVYEGQLYYSAIIECPNGAWRPISHVVANRLCGRPVDPEAAMTASRGLRHEFLHMIL